jgi:HPt (histidine-containing phosphotransfer) domain-containing protein
MTDDLKAAVQHDLDAIRHDYVAQLGESITEVAGAWEAVPRASDRNAAIRNVAHLAHTLAGTSSVLGLIDVGRAAATLEEALERVPDGGTPAAVDSALEQLVSAGSEPARSDP